MVIVDSFRVEYPASAGLQDQSPPDVLMRSNSKLPPPWAGGEYLLTPCGVDCKSGKAGVAVFRNRSGSHGIDATPTCA